MNKIRKNIFVSVWELYRDGFRNMTWGKQLWFLILLKVIILFAVLRVFFFKPAMAGMTDKQKIEHVGYNLTHKDLAVKNDTLTIVSKN